MFIYHLTMSIFRGWILINFIVPLCLTGAWDFYIIVWLILGVCGFVYVLQSSYPLYRANRTPGRPWSAWDAADHNADGKLTREEMERFGKQMSHRNVEQLLRNFDAADTNHDGIVTQQEIDAYGTDIGSKEPQNRR